MIRSYDDMKARECRDGKLFEKKRGEGGKDDENKRKM